MANHLSLKLLLDPRSEMVLFAEAGKDVVDLLFGLLRMQIGSIIRLMTPESMVGCIGNIYQSVGSLDETYIRPEQDKDGLLKLSIQSPPISLNTLLLENDAASFATKKYYYACYCTRYCCVTDGRGTLCPHCGAAMTKEVPYIDPKARKVDGGERDGGYVMGAVTYMVMDDLTVMPMSTNSIITLLNSFNVTDVSSLEESVVELGMEQGLELLKASLKSKTVLTDVFLGKKEAKVEVFLGKKEAKVDVFLGKKKAKVEHSRSLKRKQG